MTPILLYLQGAANGLSAFVGVGWGGEGYFSHHTCSLAGGLYFGHLLTEALNGGTK
jgi:hypothetical protein